MRTISAARAKRVASAQISRSQRRQVTRLRLVEAARGLFAEQGINGATVEQICQAANFSRGAFYSNFLDKEALLIELIDLEYQQIVKTLHDNLTLASPIVVTNGVSAPSEQIVDVIQCLLTKLPHDRQHLLLRAELNLHALRSPTLAQHLLEADHLLIAGVAQFLERGLRHFGLQLTVTASTVAALVIALVDSNWSRAILAGQGDKAPSLQRLRQELLPTILGAITEQLSPTPSGSCA